MITVKCKNMWHSMNGAKGQNKCAKIGKRGGSEVRIKRAA